MNESDKTKTYSDTNKTSVYKEESRTKLSVHNLKPGDKISLNNAEFTILEIISESSGEAVIYKIKNANDNIHALKLYYEFHDPENEPNTEALERIKNIRDPDILKLIDFGTGINRYHDKYCFEISDFAFGLDLLDVKNLKEKYNDSFIEKEVIPQIYKGILRLHENKIFHCDLKPQNVFYLDYGQIDIVIGDYGSAKTFGYDTAKDSRKTTTVKGTEFYLPPEQARGFISDKNDYYSFGMILLHLCYPEKILLNENDPKSLNRLKLNQIIERQFENKPIIDFNPKRKRINSLIEGLTLVDFRLRWGKEEVQQWLDGKKIEVIYQKSGISIKEQIQTQALIFGGHTIKTPYDLRDYILNDKNWYADLIEDPDNREDFFNWMLSLYEGNKSKRSALNRIIKYYSPEGIEFVGDAIIRFFIPEHPVIFGLKSFDFAGSNDIKKTTAEVFTHLIFDLWSSSSEKDLMFYVHQYESAMWQLIDEVEDAKTALKALFKSLKIKGKLDLNFNSYETFSLEGISKKSLPEVKNFLFNILPGDVKIEFVKIKDYNELHYRFSKSLVKYFAKIGIDQNLQETKTEHFVTIKYPTNYDSFDNFCDKTFENVIADICSQNSCNKEQFDDEIIDKFKSDFIGSYNSLIHQLTDEYNRLRKKYKYFDELDYQLKELENALVKEYYKIPDKYHLIHSIQKEGETIAKRRERKLREQLIIQKEFRRKNLRIIVRGVFLTLIFLLIWPGIKVNRSPISHAFLLKGIELMPVEGGSYIMGRKKGDWNQRPAHKVQLDDFYMSKYEVTNAQFARFLNEYQAEVVKSGQDSGQLMIYLNQGNIERKVDHWEPVNGLDDYPVVGVSWYGANEFCKWAGGRLPSEAEWEYVTRGGKNPKVNRLVQSIQLDSIAWYFGNARSITRKVGTKSPNELGIYDLLGNVWEWCHDWYDGKYYSKSPGTNPCNTQEPKRDPKKVIRGGAYYSHSKEVNPFYRDKESPDETKNSVGFRICWVNEFKKNERDEEN